MPNALIPVVDVGALVATPEQSDPALVAALDDACVRTGFFVAVGHGLDEHLDAVFTAARSLFGLDTTDKAALAMVERCGYNDDGAKELFDVGVADPANRWPPIDGFRATVEAYQQRALGVAAALLRTLAVALELEPEFFAVRMQSPECYLRLLRYPVTPPVPVSTLTHTDYGALTLLATDGVAGLQVHPVDGTWTDVEAPAGSLIVNLGDMLAHWTQGRYRSTPHRVVASARTDRYSVPFFVNPDAHTPVGSGLTATEFLQGRIDGTIQVQLPPE